jgi:predicted permease
MIFLIAFVAGLMVRKKLLKAEHVRGLSIVTINILLPSLIYSKITENLYPDEFPIWWMVPLIAVATAGIGIGLAWLVWRRSLEEKRNLLPLSGIMNAAYFILPVGQVIYPDQFDQFALYVALYVLGISPLVWSFGKLFVTEHKKGESIWKGMLTPPLLANFIGLGVVLSGIRPFVPEFISDGVSMLGQATVPVATLILGATIGALPWRFRSMIRDLSVSVTIKMVLVPSIVIFLLYISPLPGRYPLLANLFVLEAAAPAATAMIIQIRRYGGDEKKAGSILLVSYLACLVSIPFWLALWSSLTA